MPFDKEHKHIDTSQGELEGVDAVEKYEDLWQGKVDQIQVFANEHAKKLDTINYIYVLSKEKKLEGVLSIKELFRLPKSATPRLTYSGISSSRR